MKNTLLFLTITCATLFAQAPGQATPAEIQDAIKQGRASLVIVNTTPSGAHVSVDGVAMKSPGAPNVPFVTPNIFALFKKDSPRVLEIALEGYKPVERRINPTGAPVAIEITLEPAEKAPAAAAATAGTVSADSVPSPFGFRYGSTKEQIIKKLGSSAVAKDSGNIVSFKTAPNPHPQFELYTLFFSPAKGLLKVAAVSKDIRTSDDGSDLKLAFNTMKSGLESKYGASKSLDSCKGSDVECESQFYMMQLMENNRSLFALWSPTTAAGTGIVLEGKALGINKGYLALSYEFPGWDKYVEEMDNRKNSVF